MKPTYKNIQYFFVPYFGTFIALFVLIVTIPKAELHLMMNSYHTPFLDVFFRICNEFGAGIIPNVILMLFLFYRFSHFLYLGFSQILGGIFSVSLKHYYGELRPAAFFHQFHPEVTLPAVSGVTMLQHHSFPSGHTITAFALFFGIALIVKNRWLKLACFIIAALVGYARIYLSQHFAIDVLAGSLIGVIAAWIMYPLFLKMDEKWNKRSLTYILMRKNRKDMVEN